MVRAVVKKIRNYFFAGVIVLLPLVSSLYIFWVLFRWLDNLVETPVNLIPWEGPGAGIISAVIIILITGVLATNLVGKKIVYLADILFTRVPFIRNIYTAIKQLLDTFTNLEKKTSFKRVVMLEYPRKGCYVIGFATGDSRGEPQIKTNEELMSIFIPTTPNPTSGILVMVPKQEITFLAMTVEEGLKFVVSGGVVTPELIQNNKEVG
ncbi:DUF502 domain-containing protein [Natranaerobius trueperi]|uniref:DUF502 domain-containing protein n=1 Tax=Natranaerobius trueperi TaxID=759412 RepID=A0A226BVR5_9FIRM|nr:DUF502 domain-containing protein [Natranaerobius trueperi]OWZ83065.1 hypothetical protein CDO51_10550 [Natranaerobius trueperi]